MREHAILALLDRHPIIAQHLPAGARGGVSERRLSTPALSREEPGATVGRHHARGVKVKESALAELEDRAESPQLAPSADRCVTIAAPGREVSLAEMKLRALLVVDEQRLVASGDSIDRAVAPRRALPSY